jgi:hypothetical protein
VTTQVPQSFKYPLSGDFPPNPDGSLPAPFSFDTRGDNPPRMLEKAAVAGERATYYFMYRLVFQVYRYAFDYEEAVAAGKVPPPLPVIAPGWEQQKVHYLDYPLKGSEGSSSSGASAKNVQAVKRRRTPFAVTLVKGTCNGQARSDRCKRK